LARYILRRLIVSVPVVLAITVIIFLMTDLAPGDAVDALIDPENPPPPEQMEALREQLGLNKPFPVRYGIWLGQLLQGNLGYSTFNKVPVLQRIGQRLGNTLLLMSLALSLALVSGVLLGVISALKQYSALDYLLTVLAFTGISIPGFFVGLLAIYLFGVVLGWFPVGGVQSFDASANPVLDRLWHMTLPVLVLASRELALFMRFTRSSLLEVIRMDYVNTARSKGLKERVVITRHALRNALIPVVTLLGMRIGRLIGGIVIIEVVFSLPGIGRLLMNAVLFNDFPVLQTGVLLVALAVTFLNLLADVSYSFLDPRIRHT
jgi:peptide/nickel transport system permease protein